MPTRNGTNIRHTCRLKPIYDKTFKVKITSPEEWASRSVANESILIAQKWSRHAPACIITGNRVIGYMVSHMKLLNGDFNRSDLDKGNGNQYSTCYEPVKDCKSIVSPT